jgi:serine-type D-Ala-D-Ala carboxypeptidase (penicillin-binding protein 5/6)
MTSRHFPFITPDQSPRPRRRARWRWIAIAALAIALAAALVVMALAHTHGAQGSATSARVRAHARIHRSPAAPQFVSAIGLPLSRPAFTLVGIGHAAQDPVRVAFAVPPSAGLLVNLDTGQVLWQRNPDKRLRIASLTKMMTALLTVGSDPPNARVLVTHSAVDASGSVVGLLPLGRHVRLESLLYGLLLPSGNDAAIALAEHVAGSVNNFVRRMNVEAARLGMGCTRYSSPSGYYNEGNFSCAADLALLAHVDLQQPRIARVTHAATAALPFPIKGGKLYLYNNNPLLIYDYPGVTGLKTGYTIAAGRCLVATAERDGVRLGVVLLHSPSPGIQARDLLDSGFDDVYHQPPLPAPPMPPGT